MRWQKPAFTLIELLVVCAILGLLTALSTAAYSSLKKTARQTSELAALRGALQGWNGYAMDQNGWVLPGYLAGLPAYLRTGEPIPETTYGGAANIGARWPWRLTPYLGGDIRALFAGEQAALFSQLENGDPDHLPYFASLYPSFGLNTTWVGGDSQRMGFLPDTLPNGQRNPFSRFYVQRLAVVRNPARVIAFASSRTNATIDGSMAEGFFRIESPRFLQPQWAERYDPADPASYGNVSARMRDLAGVGTIDGAVQSLAVNELRDMRRWADQATGPDWALTAP